jgi:hypothetical protein
MFLIRVAKYQNLLFQGILSGFRVTNYQNLLFEGISSRFAFKF